MKLVNGFLPLLNSTSTDWIPSSDFRRRNTTSFLVGNMHINDHPAYVALATLFAREHNRRALLFSGDSTDDEQYDTSCFILLRFASLNFSIIID
jgi:hypothetical protein